MNPRESTAVQPNYRLDKLKAKSDEIGKLLQRNWFLDTVVAAIGILYLYNTPLAGQLISRFGFTLSLVQIGLPIVSTYLFVRMGYLLFPYLTTRRFLMIEIQNMANENRDDGIRDDEVSDYEKPDPEVVLKATVLDHSIFWFFSAIATRAESVKSSQPKQTGAQIARSLAPLSILMLCALLPYSVANALAIYLTFTLTDSWDAWIRLLVVLGGVLILSSFYAQFGLAAIKLMGGWALFTLVGWIAAAGFAAFFFICDPFSDADFYFRLEFVRIQF